jgi:hypothetical protein
MRALELRIRKKNPQSPSFKIVWRESGGPEGDTTSKAGVGLKWPDKYGIAIPPGLDLKQLRVYIAHELGHLFYLFVFRAENRFENDRE